MAVDCHCGSSEEQRRKAEQHANKIIDEGFQLIQHCKCRKAAEVQAPRVRKQWPASQLRISSSDHREPLLPVTIIMP